MRKESECDVLIVGAGLAGLSTAWHLKDSGKSIRIIELSDTVGGWTKTTERSGFRFDHTGHLLHLRDNSIKKWVVDSLFKGKLLYIDRISRVYSSGVYTRYPFQANTYGLPARVSKECIDEYLKVIGSPSKKVVKTAEDFILKHFGKGFAKHFMIPYNKKIWGTHPRNLSATWGERFIPVPKKDDVLAGTRPGIDRKLGYNSSFFYPARGMGELAVRMHHALDVPIEFGVGLQALNMRKRVATLTTGEQVRYKTLVSTIPLKELIGRIDDAPVSLTNQAKVLKCKSLNYLDIALKTPARQKYHWCYIPSPKIPFYRVGIYSNLSRALAPKGKSSLYVELATRSYSPKKLPAILKGLQSMDLIRGKSDIEFIEHHKIPYAYVIYDKNYFSVVPKIHATLNKHDIYSIGRWGGWNYSSMEDALLMGREVAGTMR